MGGIAHRVFSVKRTLGIFVAVFVFTTLVAAAFWFKVPQMLSSEREVLTLGNNGGVAALFGKNTREASSPDADADGLADWEEKIWKTDAANKDTDNDGTSDGEEVRTNRDPLKKGPGDSLASPATGIGQGEQVSQENLTALLAQRVLESGALNGLDTAGSLIPTDVVSNLELPENFNVDSLFADLPLVSAHDIPLASRNDTAAIRTYFDTIFSIYARELAPQQQRGDLAILEEALVNEDYAVLVELDPILAALDRAVQAIRATPTPLAYRSFAVSEINALIRTRRAIEIFRNTENDPTATALVVGRRIELFQELASLHQNIAADLAAKHIVLASVEERSARSQ